MIKYKRKKYYTIIPSCWLSNTLLPCSWRRNRNQCHIFSWKHKRNMPLVNLKLRAHSSIKNMTRIVSWRD